MFSKVDCCRFVNLETIDWGFNAVATFLHSYYGVKFPFPGISCLIHKSHCDIRHSSSTNGLFNSLCGKATSCLESMLCGVLVRENQETHEKVN